MDVDFVACPVQENYKPLRGAIDENIVNDVLGNKNFKSWLDKNEAYISQNPIDENKLKEYFNDNVNKVFDNTLPQVSIYGKEKNINKSVVTRMSAIVDYLFNPTLIENKFYGQVGGVMKQKLVKSIEGKLIFLVQTDTDRFYVKVMINHPKTYPELVNYRYFNSLRKTDKIVEKYVMDATYLWDILLAKITPDEQIYYKFELTDKISVGIRKQNKILFEEITKMAENGDKLFYIVTNGNYKIKNIRDVLSQNDALIEKDKNVVKTFYVLLLQVMILLIYFNKTYGFNHWDLHGENLLLKFNADGQITPLFYDFDTSSTTANFNKVFPENLLYSFQDNLRPYSFVSQTEVKHVGLSYDLIRIFDEFPGRILERSMIDNEFMESFYMEGKFIRDKIELIERVFNSVTNPHKIFQLFLVSAFSLEREYQIYPMLLKFYDTNKDVLNIKI